MVKSAPVVVTQASPSVLKTRAFRGLKKAAGTALRSSDAFELMREQFADLRRGSGTVVIASASGVQNAIESAEWSNGWFTFSVLEGLKTLKADRNKDGTVSVSGRQRH